MSIFKPAKYCRSCLYSSRIIKQTLFAVLFVSLSGNAFSGGVSDRKHEAKQHISTQGEGVHRLSLDEVLPTSRSVLISAIDSTENTQAKPEPILIRVTGYSAYDSKAEAQSEAKRLLALRASKLDAYRALAERVYGLSISSRSLVKGFSLEEDHFAVALDSHVRGARVVSVHEKEGLGFETVLELMLPGNFNDCINKVNNFKNGLNCLRPLPTNSLFLGDHDADSSKQSSRLPSERYQGSGYFLN